MKNDQDQDQELLLQKLTAELDRLDAQYDDISPPSLPKLEALIVAEEDRRQKKACKELLLFWGVSLLLLALTLAVLGYAPAVYLVLQAVIPFAALAGLAASYFRRRREGAEHE
jgi:hypothetical protein